MFRTALLASAFALVICVGAAPSQAAPSQQEQNACFNDAQRLCPEAIPDRQKVAACLSRNRSRLSRPCRTALDRDYR